MKAIKPKAMEKLLLQKGFQFVRQKGSHRLYRKGDLRVTVPYHKKDLKPGTLQSILKQAGVTREELETNL